MIWNTLDQRLHARIDSAPAFTIRWRIYRLLHGWVHELSHLTAGYRYRSDNLATVAALFRQHAMTKHRKWRAF